MAVDYTNHAEPRPPPRPPRRGRGLLARPARRLGARLARSRRIVGYGLWAIAGITQHDVTGNPNYYVVRQAIFVAVGVVALLVAALIDPAVYRRYCAAALRAPRSG